MHNANRRLCGLKSGIDLFASTPLLLMEMVMSEIKHLHTINILNTS